MRENFPRATREKERRPNPAFHRNLWRASPGLCAKKDGRASRQKAEPFFSSGLLCLFFCSSLFSFSPGKTRGARFFLLFSPSAGGKRLFPDKNRNGLSWRPHSRESLPGEPVFPLSDAPPAITSIANGHSGSAKRRKKRGKAATGASSATGTFRRPEPFGDRGKKTDKKKGNQKRQKQMKSSKRAKGKRNGRPVNPRRQKQVTE